MPYSGSKPYGDIYSVGTSAIDNIANHLYAQHQQRQKQAQDEGKALDDMFAKNVANVRDEDVNDLYLAYEKQKAAKIGLLKNNLKGSDRINADMAANKAAVEFWQVLNDSKERKERYKNLGTRMRLKPEDFDDDAQTMLAMTNGKSSKEIREKGLNRLDPDRTLDPATGKIKEVKFDPDDENSFIVRGNVQNWMPIMQKAVGDAKEVNTITEDKKVKNADGTETVIGQQITPIKATVPPVNVFQNIIGATAGSGRRKSWLATFGKDYNDPVIANQIIQQYRDKQHNDPLWEKGWGKEGMNIPDYLLLDPSTRPFAVSVMAGALAHPPTLGTPKNVEDKPGATAVKNKEWDRREQSKRDWQKEFENNVRQPNRLELLQKSMAAREGFAQMTAEEQAKAMEDIRLGQIRDGDKITIPFIGKDLVKINLSPAMGDKFGEDNPDGSGKLYPQDRIAYYDPKDESYHYKIGNNFRKMSKQIFLDNMVVTTSPTPFRAKQTRANFENKTQTIKSSSSKSGGKSFKIKGSNKSLFDSH